MVIFRVAVVPKLATPTTAGVWNRRVKATRRPGPVFGDLPPGVRPPGKRLYAVAVRTSVVALAALESAVTTPVRSTYR